MKNVWKRTLSLMLSGVLLLGSVPMGAFATEQTQEPTELVEEIQPVVAVVKDEVANVELDVPKVCVNDTEIASGDVFSNGTVVYDAAQKTLTLNEATNLTGISVEGQSLTIYLVGSNKIDAVDAVAITADKDLTITGEGSLKIVTNNAVAVSVAGVADGDNQKGLIIDGAQVSVETAFVMTETEIPVGISSANGVVIKGAAHFRTSHSRSVDKYTMECNGYLNDKVYTANSACDGGSALEFIGDEHVGEWITGNNEHYKTCSESSCALYENTAVGNHPIDDTPKYESISNTKHCVMYNCCNKVKEGLGSEKHDLNYSIADSAIQVICADCRATGSITLSANDTEKGSEELDVSYTTAGILAGKEPEIIYTNAAKEEVTPEALGKYTVTMSYEGQTVTKEIEITKINISDAVVTVGGTYTYNGTAHEPALADVMVKLGDTVLSSETDYTVTFSNNINAGAANVTVKAAEDSDYMGEAAGTFTIQKKQLDPGDVKLGDKLTYNGEEQTQTVVKADENSNVTFKVEDVKQKNAGSYTLKVEGTGNYGGFVNLEYTISPAEVEVDEMQEQVIAKGGDFSEPKVVLKADGETEVPGTFRYSMAGTENTDYAGVKSALANLNDGDVRTVSFKFTPDNSNNYKNSDNITGEFEVTVKTVAFKLNANEGITDQELKASDLSYGVEEPIMTNKIKAFVNDTETTTTGYTVTFKQNGSEVTTRPLPAGTYSFSVTYTGMVGDVQCLNYMVHSGTVEIVPKKIKIETPYAAKHLTVKKDAEGKTEPQALLTGEAVTDVTAEGIYEWVYQVTDKEKVKTIPQEKNLGVYELKYYAKSKNDNYSNSDTITVDIAILPVLEADYGKYLKDIDLTDTGFEWNKDKNDPETTRVGNVDDSDEQRTFVLKHKATPVRDEIKAVVTVNPIVVTAPVVTPKTKYVPYAENPEIEVIVKATSESTDPIPATEYTVVLGTEPETKTGERTVSVVDKENGNYTVGNGSTTVIQYRPAFMTLSKVPESLQETDFNSLEKIKTELSSEIKDEAYPTSVMKYYEIAMSKYGDKTGGGKGWVIVRDEEAFPDTGADGGFEVTIPYSSLGTGIDKSKIDFKVAIMDADTVERLGTDATKGAKIIDAQEEDEGITFHADGYSIVCVARQVDPEQKFDIKKSIVLDGSSSTKGGLTFKVDSVTVDKTNFGKTVAVTATKNTGYSIEKVTAVTDSGDTVTLTKKSEGSYEFKMPADHVTVKLSLKKTTSTSKNPSSGDSSNIYLWVVILAASGAAIGALMAFWFKKRKK